MKTVFVLFDSLNRHMLGPYGGTTVPTPNFDRLAERTPGLRPPLRRLDALHAGAPRPDDRPPHLPAPELGTARALRQRLPRAPPRRRHPLAPGHRPLPLLGGRRRHLPQPLHHLRLRPRPGERPVEGRGAPALGRAPREVPRRAGRERREDLEVRPLHDQPRVHPRGEGLPLGPGLRRARSSSSRPTATPTTGCSRSRPSTRTSPSTRPTASRSRSAPAGTARSATGRATAASSELPEEADELRANYNALMLALRPPARPDPRRVRQARPVEGHRAHRLAPTTASCSASTTSGPRTG